jgi:hypothetical protein
MGGRFCNRWFGLNDRSGWFKLAIGKVKEGFQLVFGFKISLGQLSSCTLLLRSGNGMEAMNIGHMFQ